MPQQLGDLRAKLNSKINCIILHVQLEILRYPEFQNCITVVSLYEGYLENIEAFPIALLLKIMAFLQHQGFLVTGQKCVQEHKKINAEVLLAWHIEQEGIW